MHKPGKHVFAVIKATRLGSFAAVTAACLAALLFAPGADAAPAWLSPETLMTLSPGAPQLAVSPDGRAVAVSTVWNGSNVLIQASVREAAGGGWQAPVTLSEAGHESMWPQVAIDEAGEAIAVWEFQEGSSRVIKASVLPAEGGGWQTPVTISEPTHESGSPEIVLTPGGEAIAVWSHYTGSHSVIQTSSRPAPGESWQAPVTLTSTSSEAYAPQVAVNGSGEALAVWEFDDGSELVAQAAARPSGGIWGAPATLSGTGHNAQWPRVALNELGEAVASWATEAAGKELIEASSRESASGAWGAPVKLAEAELSFLQQPQPRVAIGPQGNAVVVWGISSFSGELAQAAVRPKAGESWTAAVDLSKTGNYAEEPRVSIAQDGEAVAVWSAYNGTYTGVEASRISEGSSSWSARQIISESSWSSFLPTVAVDPRGDAVAAWISENGSESVIKASSYVATGPIQTEASIPSSGYTGEALSFSIQPVDAWSALGETTWSFGDGGSESGTSATHTYSAPGAYEVQVSSADALGNTTTTTQEVVIEAPPSQGSTPPVQQPPAGTTDTTTTAATNAGAPPPPPPSALRPPSLELLNRAPQPLINTRTLTLRLRCDGSPCPTSVAGWITLPGSHHVWRLNGFTGLLAAGTTARVHVSVPRSLRAAVRRYLVRHPHYRVMVHLEVTLGTGGASHTTSFTLPIFTLHGFR